MAVERTLAIIKPDAMGRGLAERLLERIRQERFRIVGQKTLSLTRSQAEGFYAVHRGKPFFAPLIEFMSSGPVIVLVLEAENAIARWREVMGATDPAQADPDTIRRELGTSIQQNCVHGSDAADTAAFEISYFFSPQDLR